MTTIRIATRGSAQARTQAQAVADQLGAQGIEAELVLIETLGDRTQAGNVPLHSIGGQGVFTKEVQRAVLDGRADDRRALRQGPSLRRCAAGSRSAPSSNVDRWPTS